MQYCKPDPQNSLQITFDPGIENYPNWRPDGQKIIFGKGTYYGTTRNIWIMDPDGLNQEQLTFGDLGDCWPSYRSDGARVLFARPVNSTGYTQLYTMNSDGTDVKQITYDVGDKLFPIWSPDGSHIAYVFNGDLWVMNADGSGNKQLTSVGQVFCPQWSPSGDIIAFARRTGGCEADIYFAHLANGLVAYWSFDNSDATDQSGNGNSGTIHGNAQCVDGVKGKAFSFDGMNDFIRIEASQANSTFEEITISAWINVAGCSADLGGTVTRWNQSHTYGDYYSVFLDCGYRKPRTIVGVSHEYPGYPGALSSSEIQFGNWLFFVYSISPIKGFERLYINGELVDQKVSTENIRVSDIPIIIGADIMTYQSNDYWRFFRGLIDEVRIYNRTLSEVEIKALYLAGVSGLPSMLPFCEHFEGYAVGQTPPSPWFSLAGGPATVTNIEHHSGANSIYIWGGPYASQSAVIDLGPSYPDKIGYEAWVKIDFPGDSMIVGFHDQFQHMAPSFNAVRFHLDGAVYFYRGDTNEYSLLMNEFAYAVWHKVLVEIDFTGLKANVWIDENLVGNQLSTSPKNTVYELYGQIYNVELRKVGVIHHAGNPIYVDDFCVFELPQCESPEVTAPPNVTVNTDPGSCGTIVSDTTLGTPTTSSNCSGVTVTRSGVPTSNFFPVGTTTITYTATDPVGNVATATQSVTIVDNTPPNLTLPANIVKPTDPGQCSAMVSYTVTATDNCPGVTVMSSPPSGSVFPRGVTTVAVNATDTSGNVTTGSFTVTVEDKENPVIANISANPQTL